MISSACAVRPQEEARDVARVDRFDQQPDASVLQPARGAAQVADKHRACAAGSTPAGTMPARQFSWLQPRLPAYSIGARDAVVELRRRDRDDTRCRARRRPSCRPGRLCRTCVKPCSSSRRRMLRCVVVVREEVFDAGEARAPRGREPIEKSDLVEEHRQVGGKFRHGLRLGLDAFHEDEAVALGEGSHQLEAVGLERRHRVEARRGRAPRPNSAPSPPRGARADDDDAAAGPQDAEQLAHRGRRGPRRASSPSSPPVSSTTTRSNAVLVRRAAGSAAPPRSRRARRHPRPPCAPAPPTPRRARPRRRVRTCRPSTATAARRPPCAQPTCATRSPILTPVMPTTSRCGSSRRRRTGNHRQR